MSGKIYVKQREGISRDKKYKYYPEWYLEVHDESNQNIIAKVSPSFNTLSQIISDVLLHEYLVDRTRERKPDHVKYIKWFENLPKLAQAAAQRRLAEYIENGIPEIYSNQKIALPTTPTP